MVKRNSTPLKREKEMDAFRVLDTVTSKTAPGMSPEYSMAHVLKALQLISSGEGIGRQKLSREIGVGEGTVRTLIKRLRKEGLVESSRQGLTLTISGREVLSEILRLMKEIELPKTEVTIGSRDYAVLVKKAANHVRKGVEQRDAALFAGAMGATTLVFDGEHLFMPGIEMKPDASISEMLIKHLKPERGDVIIIGSAETANSAEIGAKSATLKLMKEIKAQS